MTLPEITQELLHLIRHGGCSTTWDLYSRIEAQAEALEIRCTAVAADLPETELGLDPGPLITGSVDQLGETLDQWTKLLFKGGGSPEEVMFRLNRIVQLAQSIASASRDALEEEISPQDMVR